MVIRAERDKAKNPECPGRFGQLATSFTLAGQTQCGESFTIGCMQFSL